MSSSSHAGCSFRPPRSRASKYYLVRVPPPKLHKMIYATGGLQQLYKRVRSNAGPQKIERGRYTNSDGAFTPQTNMPLLASRYKVIRILGKGQSSVFLKAEDTFCDNAPVAIKVLHTHYHMLGAQESDCIRRLNNADPYDMAGTLRLRTMFRFDKHYCMVFELLHPRPLTDFFNGLDETKTLSSLRAVARRVLQTLGFLQQQTVIHADLKPENILLKKGGDLSTLKVVDFGNAIHCIHEELSLYYGDFELQTLLYRAPEVMFGLPFGMEIDLWSLGCILAELYIGKPLFTGCDKNEVMQKMVSILGRLPEDMCQGGKFFHQLAHFTTKTPKSKHVGEMMQTLRCRDYAFADFLLKLLKYRPTERLTVFEAACHPFLAPELGTAFLLPPNDRHQSYPAVLVDDKSYQYQPAMDDASSRRHLTSSELLRVGTSGRIHIPSTGEARQVGFVQPLQRSSAAVVTTGINANHTLLQRNPVAITAAVHGDPRLVAQNGLMVHPQAAHSGQSSRSASQGVTASQAVYYNGSSRGVAGIPQPALATVVKESSAVGARLAASGSSERRLPAATASAFQSTTHSQPGQWVWQEQALRLSPGVHRQTSHHRQTTPTHQRTATTHRMSPYLLPVKTEPREGLGSPYLMPVKAEPAERSSQREYSQTNGHISGLPPARHHTLAPGQPVPTPALPRTPTTRATPGRPDSLPLVSHMGSAGYRSLPSTPQMAHIYRVEQPAQQIHSISTTLKEDQAATPTKPSTPNEGPGGEDLSKKAIRDSHFKPVQAAPLSSPGDWGTPDSKVEPKALTPNSAREVTRSLKRYLLEQSRASSELPEVDHSPDCHVNTVTPLSEGGETSSPESGHQDQKTRPLKKRIRTCLFQPAPDTQSSSERPAFNRSLSTNDLVDYSTQNPKLVTPPHAIAHSARATSGALTPRIRSRLWIRKTEPATSSSHQSDSEEDDRSPEVAKSSPEKPSSPDVAEPCPFSSSESSNSQPSDTVNIPCRETAKWQPAIDDNDNHIVTSSVGEELSPNNQNKSRDQQSSEGKSSLSRQTPVHMSSSDESGPSYLSSTEESRATAKGSSTQTSKTVKSSSRRNNQNSKPVHKKTPDSSSACRRPAKQTRVAKSAKSSKLCNEQMYDENCNENISQTSPPAKRRRRGSQKPSSQKSAPPASPPEADSSRSRSQRSTRIPRYLQKYCNTLLSSDEETSDSDSDSSGHLKVRTHSGSRRVPKRAGNAQPLKTLSAQKRTPTKAKVVRRKRAAVLNQTFNIDAISPPPSDSESDEEPESTCPRTPSRHKRSNNRNKKPTPDSAKKTISRVPKTRGRPAATGSKRGARTKSRSNERDSPSEEVALLDA